MNVKDLVAIDVHTHAEVSCRHPSDDYGKEFDDAAAKYFKAGQRPTIAETVAYYRERKMGFVMFPVDAEFEMGRRRISNEEVAETAAENADVMTAFASIDPHKGPARPGASSRTSTCAASSFTRRRRASSPTTAWHTASTR
jgi:predicted TIM-barrel fold metal-dependent hydrolase